MTYEFENVPVDAARFVETRGRCSRRPPPSRRRRTASSEKQLFEGSASRCRRTRRSIRLACPRPTRSPTIGTPAVLKSRRLGYDGKGQAVIHDAALAEDAWRADRRGPRVARGVRAVRPGGLDRGGARSRRERSPPIRWWRTIIATASCALTLAPAPGATDAMQTAAERHARTVMDSLGYVGVLAIELFCVGERLLANEMAPRVHNCGHWTDRRRRDQPVRDSTCGPSCGLPLGSTGPVGVSAMVNLIGTVPDTAAVAADRRRAPARLRQGAAARSQDGARHGSRRRPRRLGTAAAPRAAAGRGDRLGICHDEVTVDGAPR